MSSFENFPWPVPQDSTQQPRWNGSAFTLGDQTVRVLSYVVSSSHWSEELTAFHEAIAGQFHPIDVISRRLALESMGHVKTPSPVLLDAGCSSGFLLEDLRAAYPNANVIGADFLREPLESLAKRMPAVPILQFDLRACPLPDACVDGVTSLNVLEHIDDDTAAMREIFRILKPGGIAHIEVPAGPHLYDIYDEHLMHHRRYSLKQIVDLAQSAGFEVLKKTHSGCFVYPGFWWVKRRNRNKMKLPAEEKAKLVGQEIQSTRGSVLFAVATKLETLLGRAVSWPFGIRCVIKLRKPQDVAR